MLFVKFFFHLILLIFVERVPVFVALPSHVDPVQPGRPSGRLPHPVRKNEGANQGPILQNVTNIGL
jgi:hypothetical protein